jgi:chromosome partitioning protein
MGLAAAATPKTCRRRDFVLAPSERISANYLLYHSEKLFDGSTQSGERAPMIPATSSGVGRPRVIVVGNEKGGSGKSTLAAHIAVALLKTGAGVGTIDLDFRQRSFTHYVENRRGWAERVGRDIGVPNHVCLDGTADSADADERAGRSRQLKETVEELGQSCAYLVIDTPGQDNFLVRLAHAMADTLITPLNDSFVDFDVLGTVDATTFAVSDVSHYARLVEEARAEHRLLDGADTDWIVLRNRLSTFGSSRNKRLVGEALQELSRWLNFRYVDGLAERVIFREFYPRGLTAVDDLDELTLGTRPTMSHATARLEMENLLGAILLGARTQAEALEQARDAA